MTKHQQKRRSLPSRREGQEGVEAKDSVPTVGAWGGRSTTLLQQDQVLGVLGGWIRSGV